MSAPFKHAFQQGANLKTLFSVGLSAVGKTPDVPLPELPGAKVEAVLAPRLCRSTPPVPTCLYPSACGSAVVWGVASRSFVVARCSPSPPDEPHS